MPHGLYEKVIVIADACAHCPERSLGVILGQNVGAVGNAHEDAEVQKSQDDTENVLRQDTYHLTVRRARLVFAPESIGSRTRAGVHPIWVCMSSQVSDGELTCAFRNCQLWNRRVTQGIKMKPNSDFVVPLAGVAPILAANLSKGQIHKQDLAGADLYDQVKDSIWKGMTMSPTQGVVFVDMLPYDDSLLLSTVQNLSKVRPKEP